MITKKLLLTAFLIVTVIIGIAFVDKVHSTLSLPSAVSAINSASILPSMAWNRTYAQDNLQSVASVIQTADGGLMLGGITSSNNGTLSLELMKVDYSGNPQWNKTFTGTAGGVSNFAKWLVQTSDGGYAIAGQFERIAWLAKVDGEGNMLWNQTYNGTENSVANTLIRTNDCGYALTGDSYTSNGSSSTWLLKTDAFGNEQWNTTLTNGVDSIIQTSDGGFLVTSTTSKLILYWGEIEIDCLLTKTDSKGAEQWSQVYPDFGWGWSIFQTKDGGYVLGGGKSMAILKTNAAGIKQWNQSYDVGQAWAMTQTSDGGFAIAGTAIVKTDATGNEQWELNFSESGSNRDQTYSVVQTSDGGYICGGQAPFNGSRTGWLAKINPVPIVNTTVQSSLSPSANSTQTSAPTLTPSQNLTPSPAQTQSPPPSPTPSPSIPEFPSWVFLPFLVATIALTFVMIRRRRAVG